MDTLCQVTERGYASSVRELIESPIKQYPDTILIGFAYSRVCLFLHFVHGSSSTCKAFLFILTSLCLHSTFSLQTEFNFLQQEVSALVLLILLVSSMRNDAL